MELIKNPNLPFMSWRKYGFILSGVLVIISLLLLLLKGPKLGVDFAGGALVWVRFKKHLDVGDIRASLAKIGQEQASIQKLAGTNEFVIRSVTKVDPEKFANDVIAQLQKDFTDNPSELRAKETVEPKISAELTRNTIIGVLIALFLMGIYIWFRFDFRFGAVSVLAIFHNILVVIGILILTGKEFTIVIVGALLTIVGYSINDTIVLSDRIRENRKKLRGIPFVDLINTSINETFSRTILTGFFVIVTLFCLYFLGGPVIADFAFTLIVGLIFGTYSSTFIVCALVTEWEIRSPQRRKI
ncbi:MAG: protein translocase subunit SecF [candidate division WOR-3 bacterium]|nr:protein translocase subunit SecF [candidate division WOR-3 bacterium]